MSTFAAAYEARRIQRTAADALRAGRARRASVHKSKRRAVIDRIKTDRGCQRCGVRDLPAAAFDFHHRDPDEKSFTPSRGFMSRAWDDVRAEIAKCDVLCATCHRVVEAEKRTSSS